MKSTGDFDFADWLRRGQKLFAEAERWEVCNCAPAQANTTSEPESFNADGEDASVYRDPCVACELPVPGDSGVAKVSRKIAELDARNRRYRGGDDFVNGELAGLRFALEAIVGVKP